MHEFNKSTYLQGIVDGIELAVDTIERSAEVSKLEIPNY